MPSPPPVSPGPLLLAIYDALAAHYGPQHWWPSRTGNPWEIMLGAVLVQRTAWRNVEQTLDSLEQAWGARALTEPRLLLEADAQQLEEALRPSGYYRAKLRKLRSLARFVLSQGGAEAFARTRAPDDEVRNKLLGVWGVGPETADSILLYALGRPVFVADAYAARLAHRWGLLPHGAAYAELQGLFSEHLPPHVSLFNEYHALIVAHAKEVCRPRARCEICPLNRSVPVVSGPGAEPVDWRCPKLDTGRAAPA